MYTEKKVGPGIEPCGTAIEMYVFMENKDISK
jgi:hypothetical protein